ncbi:MAG: FtsW/RodA/SpoVE family cell cycle protein [Akkermansiaceae bacterium]
MICIGTTALVVLGLIMLASTSVWVETEDSKYSHLIKQARWTGIGVIMATIVACVDYRLFKKYAKHIFIFSVILLVLCYIPGIRHTVNGETRWIKLPVLGQFQPSEISKLGVIIALGAYLAYFQSETRTFIKGFVIPGILIVFPVALIFFEKDMGTAVGLAAACFAILFIAGTRIRYLFVSAVAGMTLLFLAVKTNQNRWDRITSFMDMEANKLGPALQQWRSKLAFSNGGIDGLGLGNGAEKHGYLPFAHTDFIFPMIGEELGLWYTLGTVLCFVIIAVYGIGVAICASDTFGRLLAIGVTCLVVIPSMMNIGVTTGLLPNTGLPLPFVSYGGTNLVFTLIAVGLLVSVHRRSKFEDELTSKVSKGVVRVRL